MQRRVQDTSRCPDWSEFCEPYVVREHQLRVAIGLVRGGAHGVTRSEAIDQLRQLVEQNERWRRPTTPGPLRRGDPCNPTCAHDWFMRLHAAKAILAREPIVRAQTASVSRGLGDASGGAVGGTETARALARYAMSVSRLAPGAYNPASAMDQALESIKPGLSSKVTAKADAMIRAGVHPQAALEQALTENFDALYPATGMSGLGAWLAPKRSGYARVLGPAMPAVPQVPQRGLNGLGTTTTTVHTSTTTTRPASIAVAEAQATRMDSIGNLIGHVGEAFSSLATGITDLVTGTMEQQTVRSQQQFEQRMAQLNADRQAAEDAALREAGSILPADVGGGMSGGTILLVVLGLAAAGGAVYLITKKSE